MSTHYKCALIQNYLTSGLNFITCQNKLIKPACTVLKMIHKCWTWGTDQSQENEEILVIAIKLCYYQYFWLKCNKMKETKKKHTLLPQHAAGLCVQSLEDVEHGTCVLQDVGNRTESQRQSTPEKPLPHQRRPTEVSHEPSSERADTRTVLKCIQWCVCSYNLKDISLSIAHSVPCHSLPQQ